MTKEPILRHKGAWLAALAILFVFGFSLHQRAPYIGMLGDFHHQWLTASTVKFVENWQADGFFADSGLMLEYPRTIERPTINERLPYLSYPAGAPIEIFLLTQLLPGVRLLNLIHYFDLLNQLGIAAFIALIVASAGGAYRYLFAVTAASFYILHPSPMYWHSVVFFSDQAVLLPFVAALWLELLIRKGPDNASKKLYYAQSAILTLAVEIDWLAAILVAVLALYRLIKPLSGKRNLRLLWDTGLQLGAGPALVVAFWLYQIAANNQAGYVLMKYNHRTDTGGWQHPLLRVWAMFAGGFIHTYLRREDIWTIYLCLASLLFLTIRKRNTPISSVALVALLTCMLQLLIFAQHSQRHEFSVLKLFIPIAITAYGLMPIVIMQNLPTYVKEHKRLVPVCLGAVLSVLFCVNYNFFGIWRLGYPHPHVWHEELAHWLRDNAAYEDVFLSRDLYITFQPPQLLSISRHPVYSMQNVAKMDSYLHNAPATARYFGIMQAAAQTKCNVNPRDIVAKLDSERKKWVIVRVSANSDIVLKRCLTKEQK